MHPIAVGFWGAFFGCAVLALLAAIVVFRRTSRRIAVTGSLGAVASASYALVFLGWVPVGSVETLERLQAVVAMASAGILAVLLLLLLGSLRERAAMKRMRTGLALLGAAGFASAIVLPARDALGLAIACAVLIALGALAVSMASARHGERAGLLTLCALPCVAVAMAGLDWHALQPGGVPWQVHALSAVAGIAYLLCVAAAMWLRYSYLVEVSRVLALGANFDPVSWMPAWQPGAPGSEPFGRGPANAKGQGIVVVSISNLEMLEQLHGRAAYNHALFVCASRLRRLSLPGVELARLLEDAFVLVNRHPKDTQELVNEARLLVKRLARPVVLNTTQEIRRLESAGAVWQPSVGVGLLLEVDEVPLEVAVAGARDVSRTAWSYPSRMAWYDEAAETIAELPAQD